MRICFLTGPYFPVPPSRGGAVEKYVWAIARELARKHSVTVLSRQENDLPSQETLDSVQIQRQGGFSQTPDRLKTIVADAWYAYQWAKQLPPHDVLLVHDLMFPLIAPHLTTVQNMVVCLGRSPNHLLKYHSNSEAILVPTRSVAASVATLSKQLEKHTHVIGHPIDTSIYLPGTARPIDPESLHFLFVGRIHPEKGIDTLISAFENHVQSYPNHRLTLVGPVAQAAGGGGSAYLQSLKQKEHPAISFLPPEYCEKRLAQLYQSADIFCYPSISKGETFGISVLEAMSCGCIPLVSDLACFRDLVHHNTNGFVFDHCVSHPQTACSKMMHAIAQHPNLTAIRSEAISTCSAYSLAAIAEKMETLFNTLTDEGVAI